MFKSLILGVVITLSASHAHSGTVSLLDGTYRIQGSVFEESLGSFPYDMSVPLSGVRVSHRAEAGDAYSEASAQFAEVWTVANDVSEPLRGGGSARAYVDVTFAALESFSTTLKLAYSVAEDGEFAGSITRLSDGEAVWSFGASSSTYYQELETESDVLFTAGEYHLQMFARTSGYDVGDGTGATLTGLRSDDPALVAPTPGAYAGGGVLLSLLGVAYFIRQRRSLA